MEKNEIYSAQFGLQKLTLLVIRGKIETQDKGTAERMPKADIEGRRG